jgi:hypothetical protein
MQVLNAFKGHLTWKVKTLTSNLNTYIVIIAEGLTSQLKVLDVVVNKPPKIDYVECMGNGSYLGTAHEEQQEIRRQP